jgi:hypothetical protein
MLFNVLLSPSPPFLQGVGNSNLELIGRMLENIQVPSY